MTLAEFERCLDAWGSALDDWPPPQRAAAEPLLAHSAAARARLAQQQRFERLFDPPEMPPAPAAAALAAGATLRQQQPARGIVVPLRRNWMALRWPHMVGLAACLAAGLVIGALDLPGELGNPVQTLDLIDGTGPSDD